MGDLEHVKVVRSGKTSIDDWRSQHPGRTLLLDGESFRGADLRGANLEDADARDACFIGARLADAKFHNADLRGAQFDRADCSRADFTGAKADGASFEGADLTGAIGAEDFRPSGNGNGNESERLFFAVITLLAILAIAAIAVLIAYKPVGEVPFARGLITVIFAVGTIALALILVASRWLASSTDAGDRFQHSKEVLTLFVGIFGTVVGWYFGQSDTSPDTLPRISAFRFFPSEAIPGGTTAMSFYINGGVAPFSYSVQLDGVTGLSMIEDTTTERLVVRNVAVPKNAVVGKELGAYLTVTDQNKSVAIFQTPKEMRVKVVAPPNNSAGPPDKPSASRVNGGSAQDRSAPTTSARLVFSDVTENCRIAVTDCDGRLGNGVQEIAAGARAVIGSANADRILWAAGFRSLAVSRVSLG